MIEIVRRSDDVADNPYESRSDAERGENPLLYQGLYDLIR